MSFDSKIEWTHHTGNLWWGCTNVHSGCDNCYAEKKDWAAFIGKPKKYDNLDSWWHPTYLKIDPNSAYGINVKWNESLISRPTDEEIATLYK